jgi:hypothetical protein
LSGLAQNSEKSSGRLYNMKRALVISILVILLVATIGAANILESSFVKEARSNKASTKAAQAPATAKTPLKKLQESREALRIEAARMYDFSRSSEQAEADLQQQASTLTAMQILYYEKAALDESADKDERLVATYLLTAAGLNSQESLLKILTTPSSALHVKAPAHSVQEAVRNFEFSIRFMALEALEKNVYSSQGRIQVPAETLSQVTEHRLKAMLSLVLEGQKVQKPLLKQFIDQQIEKVQI